MKGLFHRIKMKRRVKLFQSKCLYIPCTQCPCYIDDGDLDKCKLAISLGLEEE